MYLLLVHSNSIVVATSRQHTPVHHIAMCCINAHAGVRLTHPVLYSVGVYTDTPTTCIPSDQNNCRLATYTLHVMHHAQFTLQVLTEGLVIVTPTPLSVLVTAHVFLAMSSNSTSLLTCSSTTCNFKTNWSSL